MSPARRWIRNDVVFAGLVLCFLALTYTPLADPINEPLCAVSFSGATWLLHALGVPFTANEAHRTIAHYPFVIEVTGLCSGLRALALFTAVIALLDLPRRLKAIHFVAGTLILMLVNIARVAHLFVVGAGRSASFALYHEWLWPTAIVAVVLLYRLAMLIKQHRVQSMEAARV